MPRLRITASLSALVVLLAVAASVWMSAWPRLHDRATEAAVAARTQAPAAAATPRPRRTARKQPAAEPVDAATPPAPFIAPAPQPVYTPSPRYPIEALRAHREGVVILRVQLDAQGRVGAVAVERSSGDAALDASALQAVRQWRFQPPAPGSPPSLRLPIRFHIGASATAAAE